MQHLKHKMTLCTNHTKYTGDVTLCYVARDSWTHLSRYTRKASSPTMTLPFWLASTMASAHMRPLLAAK